MDIWRLHLIVSDASFDSSEEGWDFGNKFKAPYSIDLAHIQPSNNEADLNMQINQALNDTWRASDAP